MARGPERHGFRCPCGGVIHVRRTWPAEGDVLVRYRGCRACGRGFRSIETLVDITSRRSLKRTIRAIERLLKSDLPPAPPPSRSQPIEKGMK